ncbi:uncharacterized protein A1O9_00147 [Exophiala aquamarina CBS 119918]|uniref:Phosphomutase PMU1 n=1 Tax=Exophiala aquamarina CBS 119918 TaxID=1182545 RepID=A0A072Q2P4_9EURO|nr:uncharacterized protein A1O9_00147 [Exophiala aquamarina CBS 119918]KEF62175.1 hypothetical protein A1O9_00147 [Exophiala aquamarina CBS 119918]
MVRLALSLLLTISAVRSFAYIQYSTVAGYFLQDANTTNVTTFDYTATNFGLINQSYPTDPSNAASLTQWQRFALAVSSLNSKAPKNVDYKVLFAGRHGEGWHNAAESYFGTPAWNCYWSLLDGNKTAAWSDAHLTQQGIDQALKANRFWKSRLQTEKIPPPQSYYTSPLYRCLATANLTFAGLPLPSQYPFIPTVKEKLREGISEHTCDRRSNETYIASSFPSYQFEAGFLEDDELWTGATSETSSAQDLRSKQLLDDVFTNDCSVYISFTSHSGEIASLLRVLGHRAFSLSTGAVIPVLVKAETIDPAAATSTISAAS